MKISRLFRVNTCPVCPKSVEQSMFKQPIKKPVKKVNKSSTLIRKVPKVAQPVAELETPRKSIRKTKSKVQAERLEKIQRSVREGTEHGLEARMIPGKGRGVFSTKNFSRGDFVAEYAGDLIEIHEAKMREWAYGKQTGSSYMFYFNFKCRDLW